MIQFFGNPTISIYAVKSHTALSSDDISKLSWLFGNQELLTVDAVNKAFIGPRATMITPWSTNAVEITQNMSMNDILRIEYFFRQDENSVFDPMLQQKYPKLDQSLFDINHSVQPIIFVNDIAGYNQTEGLALSDEEVTYLSQLADRIGRSLTDSEVFGFSQLNSEHCRHKIFNGTFIIDGEEQALSLFDMIKQTSKVNPNSIVSAYKDNVAFIKGPKIKQFAPDRPDIPDFYHKKSFDSVISLKAETHNFPTTVEPFNGAATGSGGEIRDRLAGGKGSLPLAGTAVYMTSYSRLTEDKSWENQMPARPWLYQTPIDILIKASNGASDFGNKFGQPLISGSLLTFEHQEHDRQLGYDKVIMMAGGIGYAKRDQALKDTPQVGDKVVILGGDNYRIGMGGAAVSSTDTGAFSSGIELNAVQRSNPEMQKRAANAIRGMVESDINPIVSIHDHGAGGHLNCLAELVEDTGGWIHLDKLPLGDPTLSAKEIIGNESQERMGLVIADQDYEQLKAIADRERAPIYQVGEITGDHRFKFESDAGERPMDVHLDDLFGSSPKTILDDQRIERNYQPVHYNPEDILNYTKQVLQMEAVACKDWLTNKVDRCVGGRVAKQQCCGALQLPLNDVGVMALDYEGTHGTATSIGHSPISGLIDPVAGAKNSIAEALTNIIWAPLSKGLKSVSLSANWMWPCRNEGEDARLYDAVKAVSAFAISLGINVPTGKDSLSMKQKYPHGEVIAPGTVVISAAGHCDHISKVVEPVFQLGYGEIYYINLSQDDYHLGGSSFAQMRHSIGAVAPTITDDAFFKRAFDAIQNMIKADLIIAGHDISAGGMMTCLLECCFPSMDIGATINLNAVDEEDMIKLLFAENAGIIFQARDASVEDILKEKQIECIKLGQVTDSGTLQLCHQQEISFDIAEMRDQWYKTSYHLDSYQTANGLAKTRFENYHQQALAFKFPPQFTGALPQIDLSKPRPKAAVIREKGSNSERELAHALFIAGFDVKDVHMTDLISGRETLEDIRFLGAVGGFSNSDVLGSAKGWAGAFKYNEKANLALNRFFSRDDVLSIGICNGCQLFIELDLINPDHEKKSKMLHNDSHKHESAFTSVDIKANQSIMLSSLAGANLGVWISHGEGKFYLPETAEKYNVVAHYSYDAYPANPNGSDLNAAMIASDDGRHLVTMPHIERSIFQWNWAHYITGRQDEVSPWLAAFVNARRWVDNH